jgi:saccharopine dehydrogenase (NAD+, L-lysine-forming)
MMRVAVLGGGGTIAPAIVRDLAESGSADRVDVLDINEQAAVEVAENWGLGTAHASRVDANADLAHSLEGVDVLINSASYRINLKAMRACLDAGCHYLDLGGLYWMTAKQLELDAEFRAAGLLAILGIGSSPGKTNVMAARAVRELEGPPDAIHVFAAGRDLDPPEGFSSPYSVQTLVDELTLAPVVLENGAPREIEPMSDGAAYEFPEPIGRGETIYTLHSELSTFGESFGCRESSFRLSLAPAFLERIRHLAAAPPEEVRQAANMAHRPSASTVSVHVIEATAGDQTARVTCITRPMTAWGLGGGIVSTAAPAVAAVKLLAERKIAGSGVLPPERCIDPDDLFPILEHRGSEFIVEGDAVKDNES